MEMRTVQIVAVSRLFYYSGHTHDLIATEAGQNGGEEGQRNVTR